jgi:hypothetical protein
VLVYTRHCGGGPVRFRRTHLLLRAVLLPLTVGYGDTYPITGPGRVIAVCAFFVGASLPC